MKLLLINPPHKSIGSRLAKEHLPPLGLLAIGGPLIDNGYDVSLLDADYSNMSDGKILAKVKSKKPDVVLIGHSGSSSAQPIINRIVQAIKSKMNNIIVILGGVYPTFHWKEILETNPGIDYIVRGEGEQVVLDLMQAISNNTDLSNVKGIAYRKKGIPVKNEDAELITNLDEYRIAWELMGDNNYTYWGRKKAVVIQFSRGCPQKCTYCGQNIFWKKWRNRAPQLLADEIEMLHKKYKIEVINFADESPAANQKEWIAFLKALIAKNLNMILVASIRADHIVRDAAYLHLYKEAGFERFLLGIENYKQKILNEIRKSSKKSTDKEAIRLLREHNIISMATYVIGFGEEKFSDFYYSLKQLLNYDPDQIQMLFVTPHKWTDYFLKLRHKKIIQPDQSKWDYKHQVIEIARLAPWKVLVLVKLIEAIMQTRPKAIRRWLFHKERKLRKAMGWYNSIGKRVWFHEIFQFFFSDKVLSEPVKLETFLIAAEQHMNVIKRKKKPHTV